MCWCAWCTGVEINTQVLYCKDQPTIMYMSYHLYCQYCNLEIVNFHSIFEGLVLPQFTDFYNLSTIVWDCCLQLILLWEAFWNLFREHWQANWCRILLLNQNLYVLQSKHLFCSMYIASKYVCICSTYMYMNVFA